MPVKVRVRPAVLHRPRDDPNSWLRFTKLFGRAGAAVGICGASCFGDPSSLEKVDKVSFECVGDLSSNFVKVIHRLTDSCDTRS